MAAVSEIQSKSFVQPVPSEGEAVARVYSPPFYQRAITQLTSSQDKLDHLMPNSWIQNKIDYFLQKIEQTFQSTELQTQLEPAGNWKYELALFLARLPKKVALNIFNSLKNLVQMILQGSLYLAAHPMKAPLEIAKKIIHLAHELCQPEAWIRIGANTMGSSLGYSLLAPNPISPIVLIIGASLVAAGISVIAVKAALDKINPSSKLVSQGKTIVEEMTTGLCLGMLIGGIQRAVRQIKQWNQNASYEGSLNQARREAAKTQAEEFLKLQNLPEYDRIRTGTDSISIYYDLKKALTLPKELPNAHVVFDSFTTKVHVIPGPIVPGGYSTFSLIEIKTEMMGYEFAMQKWAIPPAPPPIPAVSNIANPVFAASTVSAIASDHKNDQRSSV